MPCVARRTCRVRSRRSGQAGLLRSRNVIIVGSVPRFACTPADWITHERTPGTRAIGSPACRAPLLPVDCPPVGDGRLGRRGWAAKRRPSVGRQAPALGGRREASGEGKRSGRHNRRHRGREPGSHADGGNPAARRPRSSQSGGPDRLLVGGEPPERECPVQRRRQQCPAGTEYAARHHRDDRPGVRTGTPLLRYRVRRLGEPTDPSTRPNRRGRARQP